MEKKGVRLNGHSKLMMGMNVSVIVCLYMLTLRQTGGLCTQPLPDDARIGPLQLHILMFKIFLKLC